MSPIDSQRDKLLFHSKQAVREFFLYAIHSIDDTFGQGYAEQHPELVGALVKAMAIESAGVNIGGDIAEQLERLSLEVKSFGSAKSGF